MFNTTWHRQAALASIKPLHVRWRCLVYGFLLLSSLQRFSDGLVFLYKPRGCWAVVMGCHCHGPKVPREAILTTLTWHVHNHTNFIRVFLATSAISSCVFAA